MLSGGINHCQTVSYIYYLCHLGNLSQIISFELLLKKKQKKQKKNQNQALQQL